MTLRRRHARRGLVHQQQARAAGKRDGELDALQVAVGQFRAWPVCLEAHACLFQQLIGFLGTGKRGKD